MDAPALPSFSPDISPALTEVAGLSDSALDLVAEAPTVADSLSALADNKLFIDTVVALSQGLTKEAAVLWGVEAAKMVMEKLPEEELGALAAAEDWLATGADALGELSAVLEDNPMQGPGAWTALAADWAGKAAAMAADLSPPYAKAIESAIKLSAALTKNEWPLFEQELATDAAMDMVDALTMEVPEMPEMPDAASAAMDAASAVADAQTPPPELALNDLLEPFVELGMKIAAQPPPVPDMPSASSDPSAPVA